MEERKDSEKKNIIAMLPRCMKSYNKLIKRCDPGLKKDIGDALEGLETDSELGSELTQNLKGMRSIHIDRFRYRIVYEVEEDDSETVIVIHSIAHRKKVYDDLAAYVDITQE